ncbi:hypothetical protein QCA50_008787 [Cerrena zonata]|uniref:Uncharacterized protein n=1 Tax=Cerrena zonata TaxID=2478898 RepID=A0AAW0GAS9_9APHY
MSVVAVIQPPGVITYRGWTYGWLLDDKELKNLAKQKCYIHRAPPDTQPDQVDPVRNLISLITYIQSELRHQLQTKITVNLADGLINVVGFESVPHAERVGMARAFLVDTMGLTVDEKPDWIHIHGQL